MERLLIKLEIGGQKKKYYTPPCNLLCSREMHWIDKEKVMADQEMWQQGKPQSGKKGFHMGLVYI